MTLQSIEGEFVTTCGYRTHYFETGRGEPLILIHGGGAGADAKGNWESCAPLLAQQGFRAIAYDMVGFGYSEAPDPANFTYSQDSRIDQLIAFIEALGLPNVHIVGNSMGGATALGVAMRRPDLVKKLVLMGSAGLSQTTSGAIAAIVNYDFTANGMREIVKALTAPGFTLSEELIEYRHRLSVTPDVQRAYRAVMTWVKAAGGLFYPEDDIRRVKVEALVVQGKDDKVVPMSVGYRFLELLENSQGYFIPHCGHWAMIEQPELFVSITTRFLRDEAGSPARERAFPMMEQ